MERDTTSCVHTCALSCEHRMALSPAPSEISAFRPVRLPITSQSFGAKSRCPARSGADILRLVHSCPCCSSVLAKQIASSSTRCESGCLGVHHEASIADAVRLSQRHVLSATSSTVYQCCCSLTPPICPTNRHFTKPNQFVPKNFHT